MSLFNPRCYIEEALTLLRANIKFFRHHRVHFAHQVLLSASRPHSVLLFER